MPKIDVSRILEKVKLNNTFLALGFIICIITIITEYETGLKIGLITLFFGGVFRVLNIIGNAIPKYNRFRPPSQHFFLMICKFMLWFIVLGAYLLAINKIIPIL